MQVRYEHQHCCRRYYLSTKFLHNHEIIDNYTYRLAVIFMILFVLAKTEVKATQVEEEELLDTFEVLDFNDDGVLSLREIRGATKQLGQKMSAKELNMFFSIADKNGDKKISKDELSEVLASYSHSGSGL